MANRWFDLIHFVTFSGRIDTLSWQPTESIPWANERSEGARNPKDKGRCSSPKALRAAVLGWAMLR